MIASSKSQTYDALIVGAGPAGTSAAFHLASQGLSVALLEKEQLPRYKTCGGGVVYRCLRQLPFSVDECVENQCFQAQMRILGTGMTFQVERSAPIVTMTMRSDFDFRLLEEARKAGVQVYDQTRCREVTHHGDSIAVESDQQGFRCLFLLAADGVNSPVAGRLNWPDRPFSIPALEWELEVPAKVLDRYQGRALFDFNALGQGYGWVFPKRRHLSVGVLSYHRGNQTLRRKLLEYLSKVGVPSNSPILQSGHQIPVRPRPTLSRNRVLLLGDAAGLAEPVTCEGITFAIQSGRLAARALVDQELRSADSEENYRQMIEQEIGCELSWGRAVAALTYRYPRLRDLLFRRQGQRLCEVMTDVFMGETTYRSLARQPLSYLKLLASSEPG